MNIQARFAAASPRKRALAASAAALLMAGGFYAYSAQDAQQAHASTQVTGGLDVSVNPGSTTVGLGTVTTTVTYTCTDASAPNGQAALRVEFDQNDNDANAEVAVACGSSDVGKTQNVTAVQLGMSGGQEVTVTATLDDRDAAATSIADTVDWQASIRFDPIATFPGDGSITVTGSYNCASDVTAAASAITAEQDNSSTNNAAGVVVLPLSTCNGRNQPFDIHMVDSNVGGSFLSSGGVVVFEAAATTPATGLSGISPQSSVFVCNLRC